MTRTSPTRITVARLDLIEAIKARQVEDEKALASALAKYENDLAKYREKAAKVLQSYLTRIERGDTIDVYSLRDTLPSVPQKPTGNKYDHASALRLLNIAQDETFSVSVNDSFYRYLV